MAMKEVQKKNSELLSALSEENIPGVILALQSPLVDLDRKDQHGNTPLLIAFMTGNLNMTKILLENGANVLCSSRVRTYQ
jgi:hypothetical protein